MFARHLLIRLQPNSFAEFTQTFEQTPYPLKPQGGVRPRGRARSSVLGRLPHAPQTTISPQWGYAMGTPQGGALASSMAVFHTHREGDGGTR